MECNELLGYITYENKEMGKCRLLDYSDEWGLADDNEKRLIRIAAAGEEMLEALQHAATSEHHPACKARGEKSAFPERYCTCHVQKARVAINKATGK